MALFEDENLDELDLMDEDNPYLSNSDKGLDLIRSILQRGEGQSADKLSDWITGHIKPLLSDLDTNSQRLALHTLDKVESQLAQMRKVRLLDGKAVLGIGGRFSAGKSCFINSLTKAGLPEGLEPTTSIATYIVKDAVRRSEAFTVYNRSVELDDMAVDALTHEFSRKYHIGFSRLIESVAIYSPDFRYPNIAILDTPGYSKADVAQNEDASDAEIARIQLGAADYLIWLMDIEGGVITYPDLQFLRSLNVETAILFVFNKAGLVTEQKAREIVTETRELLNRFEKKTYGVIAYDSYEERTILEAAPERGKDTLTQFLSEIDRNARTLQRNPASQIRLMKKEVCRELAEKRAYAIRAVLPAQYAIAKTPRPEYLRPVIEEYREGMADVCRLEHTEEKLKKACVRLCKRI